MADTIKLVVAALLVAAGIAGYYALGESALILKVMAILAGLAAGCAVGWYTAPGRQFVVYAGEAVVEAKKVVWPTRKETVTTGIMVAILTSVLAVFFFGVDKMFSAIVQFLLGLLAK